MRAELLLFLLFAIIIIVSKFAGHASRRYLHQPIVLGEILAGLLLGPSLLNIFGWGIFGESAGFLREVISALAGMGVLLLMFIAGLETDLHTMRSVGKSAFWTAFFGVVLPFGMGILLARAFAFPWLEAAFVGAVLTATSVSISAQTLLELGQLRSREGITILGAAVIDDILGIIILSVVIAFGVPSSHGEASIPMMLAAWTSNGFGAPGAAPYIQVGITIVLILLFFVVTVLFGPRLLTAVVNLFSRLAASHAVTAAALLLVLVFAVGAEYIGQVAYITGAYLVGLFLGQTQYRQSIEHGFHPLTYALFVPIFFMNIGLSADIGSLGGSVLFVLLLVGVAIFSKLVGCGAGAQFTGFTTREATRVGAGMISRGEVGLIIAQIGLVAGAITENIYTAVVVMVLATTVITPILLHRLFPRVVPAPKETVFESVADIEWEEEVKD
ncbi:MAG: cation:proton antiporter [Armatimonadota bacterium]